MFPKIFPKCFPKLSQNFVFFQKYWEIFPETLRWDSDIYKENGYATEFLKQKMGTRTHFRTHFGVDMPFLRTQNEVSLTLGIRGI